MHEISRSFDTVLVANRGEIAMRVFRTARAMGLRTVAVYSQPDANLPHAHAADRAVLLGGASAAESYLDIGKIIDAARRTGAQAVHPGYGFLSESEPFAAACHEAGLVFIGPAPQAIRDMGDKAAAKEIMRRCGVPCIPGYDGADQADATFAHEATRIGYPVMVKAMAGGGGKGMRWVTTAAALPEALRGARSEALKSFGDGRLMLEKAVIEPRHVEVQVFGDRHGNVVYLGDRDCSIQRRHQKVIEEAPAPGLSDELRQRMGAAAVQAANAVRYEGAGTVEFLLTHEGAFFFLEMNTRLQVEHPVTEMVTGLDLVEWQIRVARGETLPLKQEQVVLHGHSIEVRVYAEDPAAGFLPQSGQLTVWQPPQGVGIRVDHGLAAGSKVSTFYDPMVAKVIAFGPDRDLARVRLAGALERFAIGGLRNNLTFLQQCLRRPAFIEARLDTGFLEREPIDHAIGAVPDRELVAIAASLFHHHAAVHVDAEFRDWHSRPWAAQPLSFECGDWCATVRISVASNRHFSIDHNDTTTQVELLAQLDDECQVRVDGLDVAVRQAWQNGQLDIVSGPQTFRFTESQPAIGALTGKGSSLVEAPMPGSIVEVRVEVGAQVKAGEVLLILEAMKMEHQIVAPVTGRIEHLDAAGGQQVGMRHPLARIVAATAESPAI